MVLQRMIDRTLVEDRPGYLRALEIRAVFVEKKTAGSELGWKLFVWKMQ